MTYYDAALIYYRNCTGHNISFLKKEGYIVARLIYHRNRSDFSLFCTEMHEIDDKTFESDSLALKFNM